LAAITEIISSNSLSGGFPQHQIGSKFFELAFSLTTTKFKEIAPELMLRESTP
jgi:hypothetical protein